MENEYVLEIKYKFVNKEDEFEDEEDVSEIPGQI
jgi:hypothetical protein